MYELSILELRSSEPHTISNFIKRASEKPQYSVPIEAEEILGKANAEEKVTIAPSINVGAVDDLNLDTVHAEPEYSTQMPSTRNCCVRLT